MHYSKHAVCIVHIQILKIVTIRSMSPGMLIPKQRSCRNSYLISSQEQASILYTNSTINPLHSGFSVLLVCKEPQWVLICTHTHTIESSQWAITVNHICCVISVTHLMAAPTKKLKLPEFSYLGSLKLS